MDSADSLKAWVGFFLTPTGLTRQFTKTDVFFVRAVRGGH